jgi:hypothetical protein
MSRRIDPILLTHFEGAQHALLDLSKCQVIGSLGLRIRGKIIFPAAAAGFRGGHPPIVFAADHDLVDGEIFDLFLTFLFFVWSGIQCQLVYAFGNRLICLAVKKIWSKSGQIPRLS